MKSYHCRLNQDTEWCFVEGFDPYDAAENYAEALHSSMDYPNFMEVLVLVDEEVVAFDIEVECVPSFHATKSAVQPTVEPTKNTSPHTYCPGDFTPEDPPF